MRVSADMLLTVAQAAAQLAVCAKTLRRAIDRGELPVVRLGETARADRIHPADLENYINKLRRARPTCRSSVVVPLSTWMSHSGDSELSALLDAELHAPKRARSKRSRSVP